MKKLFNVIVFVVIMMVGCFLVFFEPTKLNQQPIYISKTEKIVKAPVQTTEIKQIISTINDYNNTIQNLYLNDMPIKLQQKNGPTMKFSGCLSLQKDKNFRLIINHKITGKEMDIGSNEKFFWFWSKRMNPPYLHYAKHDELNKTMLRVVLNPNWMMESLNVFKIENSFELTKIKNFYALIEIKISPHNEILKILTLIEPSANKVIGRYLYQEENLLASTEYHDFENGFATRITINWYEESIYMEWNLKGIEINTNINPASWRMPDSKNKINLAD